MNAVAAKPLDLQGIRVLLVAKNLLNSTDAQAQQSEAVIGVLRSAGAQVDIVCARFIGDLSDIPSNASIVAVPAQPLARGSGLLVKVARKVRRNMDSVKELSRWGRTASRKIKVMLEQQDFDCIVSLGLPMESHIAVLGAHPRKPWLAYFSDPWPEAILPAPMSDFAIPGLTAWQRRTVRTVLKRADALAFSCREQMIYMAKYYHEISKATCHELIHVAPPAGIRPLETRNSRLKIVYAGAIGRERTSPALCEALDKFARDSDFEVHFAGTVHQDMMDGLATERLIGKVVFHGWISKIDSQKLCLEADFLLLIESEMAAYPFLPSKLADYAATGRPILAITGLHSPSARLISRHQAGVVCEHEAGLILDGLRYLAREGSPGTAGLYAEFSEAASIERYGTAIRALIAAGSQ